MLKISGGVTSTAEEFVVLLIDVGRETAEEFPGRGTPIVQFLRSQIVPKERRLRGVAVSLNAGECDPFRAIEQVVGISTAEPTGSIKLVDGIGTEVAGEIAVFSKTDGDGFLESGE